VYLSLTLSSCLKFRNATSLLTFYGGDGGGEAYFYLSKKICSTSQNQQSIIAKQWVPTSGYIISSCYLILGYSASTITQLQQWARKIVQRPTRQLRSMRHLVSLRSILSSDRGLQLCFFPSWYFCSVTLWKCFLVREERCLNDVFLILLSLRCWR